MPTQKAFMKVHFALTLASAIFAAIVIVLIKFRRDNSGDNLCNNLPYVGSCQIGYLFAISGLVVILITAAVTIVEMISTKSALVLRDKQVLYIRGGLAIIPNALFWIGCFGVFAIEYRQNESSEDSHFGIIESQCAMALCWVNICIWIGVSVIMIGFSRYAASQESEELGQEDVQCLGEVVELQYIAGCQQSPDILAEGGEQSFPTYKEMTKHIEDFSAAPPDDIPEEMPPVVLGGDIQDGGDAPAVADTAQSSNASRPANEACGVLPTYMTVDLTDQNRSAPADESLATADILAKEYPGLEPNTSPACQSTYESFISASNNGNIGDALYPDRPSQSSQVAVHVYDTPMLVCKDTDLKDASGSSSEAPTPIQIPGISREVTHAVDGSKGELFPDLPPSIMSGDPQHSAEDSATAFRQSQPPDDPPPEYTYIQPRLGQSAATPDAVERRTQQSAHQDLQLQHGSVSSEYESLEMMLDQELPHKVVHTRDGSEGERFPNPPPPVISDQPQHIADAPPTVYEQVQPSDVRQSQYMPLHFGTGESAATPGDAKNQTQPSVYQELQLQHTPTTSEYQCLGSSSDQ